MAKQRWFRFSLRTLFVLVTAVACWLGWQLKWIRDRREFLKSEAATFAENGSNYDPYTDNPAPPWPLGWFGEVGHTTIHLFVEGAGQGHLTPNDSAKMNTSAQLFTEAKGTMLHASNGYFWMHDSSVH